MLHGGVPRSSEHRVRQARHAQRAAIQQHCVCLGRQYVFLGLFPLRSPQQPVATPLWRTVLDRPDHAQLGGDFHGRGLHRAAGRLVPRRIEHHVLRAALSVGHL
ncbi:hypothetical protein D3C76_1333170 [compost metagenome]